MGNSLDARLVIARAGEEGAFLEAHAQDLALITMVSELAFADQVDSPTLENPEGDLPLYAISATTFAKCPRCWKRRAEVGVDGQEICHQCQAALDAEK